LEDPLFDTSFAEGIYTSRYQHPSDGNWQGTTRRVVNSVMGAIDVFDAPIDDAYTRLLALMGKREFVPGGRYLYAAGRDFHQVNNCVLLRCPDSREGWATTSYQAEMSLMTGAGIGVWYGDVRASGQLIKRTGGTASGPLPKAMQINDTGRHIMQGGNRRSAIWGGLPWWHHDVLDWIVCKDWSEEIKRLRAEAFERGEYFPAPMDGTNISVTLDDTFFWAYESYEAGEGLHDGLGEPPEGYNWHTWARKVYDDAVAHMLRYGEPGFTVDPGDKHDEVLRNACTEITSADDSDVCNLGSMVLPAFDTPDQFGAAVRDAALFLTAGSVYSEVPYEKVKEVRDSNRRLGLGIMGLHEFLIKRGLSYGSDDAFEALEPYMREYARALEYAHDWQDRLGLSHSLGATAIAPNGTIGIIAETTPSADPIYSTAEIRTVKIGRAMGGDTHQRHIIVDPVAKRLTAEGVDPASIEDAHTLSLDPERRIRQQAFLQRYVDHAISSTINLAEPITADEDVQNFGATLLRYLPELRGMTVYPNGAQAAQPRTPVDLAWALEREGTLVATDEETCVGGVCGV
jgi:ribonucleoside-diphosphate reductase alpha chain